MEARGPAAGMPRRPQLGRRARAHRFGFVLLLVLAYACFQVAAPDAAWAGFLTILLGAATLLAAVWAAGAERLVARAAAAAAVLVAATAGVYLAVTGSVPALLGAIANGLLVAIAPLVIAGGIVRNVRTERAVTLHTLSGVLAIYLLAGMFFSFLFGAVDAVDDGNFFAEVADASRSDFLYFSYVTLSTTGYGDLVPANDVGRMLAVAEALLGQIYLVTIVALIVANLRPRR
jgi:Ion channel